MTALLDPDALQRIDPRPLAEAFVRAGYDANVVAQLETLAPRKLDAVRLPLVHAWLRGRDEPGFALARLFAYADALAREHVRALLGETLLAQLCDHEVLVGDEQLRSRIRIMPFEGLWIASDEAPASADPVMGPGATTAELALAMDRSMSGATVLDVGCGAGSLALVAKARGADRVLGCDIDPRAVALAQWNARLNDLPVEFVAGDLLGPVGEQRFDRIVAQPPFVPSVPGLEATTFLDGGSRGDELSFRLLGELQPHLNPGGRALLRFDVPHETVPLSPRVRDTIGDDLQALLVLRPGHRLDELAIGYASARHPALGPAYARAVAAYRDHLERLEVQATYAVLVELRVPLPGERVFTVALHGPSSRPYDAQALAELRQAVTLAGLPDEDLLAHALVPNRYAEIVDHQPLGLGAPDEGQQLRCAHGRCADQALSPASSVLLEAIRDHESLAEAIAAFAVRCEATPDEVQAQVLTFIREGLVSGLLVGPTSTTPEPDANGSRTIAT